MSSVKVVGLGGSLSPRSTSLMALDRALASARQAGAETQRFSISDLGLPLFSDRVPVPEAAQSLADAVAGADAMIWSSPMYHGSMAGAFKNALDWLQILADREPPYLTDKVVGLIATAGGIQGLQAINTMEFVARALRAFTLPLVVPVSRAWSAFDQLGQPRHEDLEGQLDLLGREVVRAATRRGGMEATA